MTRTWQITDTTATDETGCSPDNGQASTQQARELSESSFGTDQAFGHNNAGDTVRALYFVTDSTGVLQGDTWPSGEATLNLTIATGDTDIQIESVYFCNVDNSLTTYATWNDTGGSNPGTGLAEDLSTGDHAITVDVQELTSRNNDDRLAVIVNIFQKAGTHGNNEATYDASLASIVTPFVAPPKPKAPKLAKRHRLSNYPNIQM